MKWGVETAMIENPSFENALYANSNDVKECILSQAFLYPRLPINYVWSKPL